MARNRASKSPTVADLKRLVDAAVSAKKPKRNGKKAGSNGGRSSVTATTVSNPGPTQRGLPNGAVRISNSEYVTDVGGTSGIVGWDLNPNSGGLFTWLSRVAVGYELFRFTKLVFHYTPICSSAVTGMIVMAPDYDASDVAPSDKQAMSAYAGSKRGNVWNKLSCSLSPPKGWYFVGNNSGQINPVGTDVKFYDVAKFYAAVFSSSTSAIVGEITVEYDCEFMKPDFGPPSVLSEYISMTSPTVTNPAGSAQGILGNLPVAITSTTPRTMTFTFKNLGTFLIQVKNVMDASTNYNLGWEAVSQMDPGGSSSKTIPWVDYVTNQTSPNTGFAALGFFYADVKVGTTLFFTLAASITAVSSITFRITATDKKAIGGY